MILINETSIPGYNAIDIGLDLYLSDHHRITGIWFYGHGITIFCSRTAWSVSEAFQAVEAQDYESRY